MHRRLLIVLLAVTAVFAAATCSLAEDQQQKQVEKILLKKGNGTVGAPGETIELQAELLGPVEPGFLGGKGERLPVLDAPAEFVLVTKDSGAQIVGDGKVVSDAGGKVKCKLQLGKEFGDVYVKLIAAGKEGKPCTALFRVTAGIKIFGDDQEGLAGTTLDDPLKIQILDTEGNPVSDVPVYFSLESGKSGAGLTPENAVTDKDGCASAFLKLPEKTGRIHVTAEVADPNKKYVARGIQFQAMSLNKTLMIIQLLGGLALFIFGMKLMSEGLQRVAGEKLKWILRMFTRNRFIAITVGMMVTALIQSSSACTVMTVGFVNAGLITLKQAIGVVFGANIGTTVTGQIIAFKLNDLAFPAIVIGLIISMTVKNRTHRFWGQAIMGFGLLFLGMSEMSSTLKPLRESPSFKAFFHGFDCAPVDGVMPLSAVLYSVFIGTAMTVVIQSSSATIGLAMALAGGGLINFYTAVPIVLGDNIGTTITAVLASIGTNRTAKRTALAHALFNVFGATYMIILFYVPAFWKKGGQPIFLELVNEVTKGQVFAENPENIERHIAMAHTIFNVANVLLFLPFVGTLERVCNAIIPRSKAEEKLRFLEPHLLNQPSIALEQAIKELGYMSTLSFDAITEAYGALDGYDEKLQESLQKREDKIDRLQADITQYLQQLSTQYLSDEEAQMLAPLMHAVNDVERIGDHAENIFELASLKNSHKLGFTQAATDELQKMFKAVRDQFQDVIKAIEQRDTTLADKALKLEETINEFDHKLHDGHVERLEAGECNTQSGVVFLDLVANLEKVGDHLTNIAERLHVVIDLAKDES